MPFNIEYTQPDPQPQQQVGSPVTSDSGRWGDLWSGAGDGAVREETGGIDRQSRFFTDAEVADLTTLNAKYEAAEAQAREDLAAEGFSGDAVNSALGRAIVRGRAVSLLNPDQDGQSDPGGQTVSAQGPAEHHSDSRDPSGRPPGYWANQL